MKNAALRRHAFAGFAVGTATIALVACKEANDFVGPHTTETETPAAPSTSTPLAPSPTPGTKATATATPLPKGTPPPPIEVGGAWSGTFATSDPTDCVPAVAALSLRVTQNGASIQATLPALPCGFDGLLEGNVTVRDLLRPLSDGSIEVHPGGQLELHR